MNSSWDEYTDKDLNFFNDVDLVFILFNGKISDVNLFANLLEGLNK